MSRTAFLATGAAVVLLAAALRLPGLDDQSLWSDEIYSIESATWPVPVLLTVRDGHPPLYGLLIKALDQMAPSDLHGRAISAVAGIATVAAMLGLGAAVAGRPAALIAAGLLAVSPLHVWYSREGRMYALLVLWTVLGSWLFVRALRDGARRAWAGFALVSVAGLATHYLYGPVLLAQAAFVGLRFAAGAVSRRRLALAAGAMLGLAAIGLVLLGDEAAGVVARRRRFEWMALPYTAFTFIGGFGLGPPVGLLQRDRSLATIAAYWPELAAAAVAAGAMAWAARRALPSAGPWGLYLVCWLLVPAAVVFGGAWLADGTYTVRYLLPALPAFVLLAAIGLVGLPRRWGALLAALVGVLASVAIARDRLDPRYQRDDLRGAAHWLRAHAGTQQRILASASYIPVGLRHYEGALQLEPLAPRALGSAAEAEALVAALADTGGWLVLSREWEDDPAGHLARAIAARAPGVEVARFPGIRIFRFRPDA